MNLKITLTSLFLALSSAAQAAEPVQQHNSNAVWFENWIGLNHALMRVASPDGDITDVRADQGTPVFELSGANVVDGVYRYELRAATEEMVKNRDYDPDSPDAGEDGAEGEFIAEQYYSTGWFVVERGVIIDPVEVEESDEEG